LADTEERFDEAELEMENGCLVPTMFWNEWEKITKLKLSQQDNKEGTVLIYLVDSVVHLLTNWPGVLILPL